MSISMLSGHDDFFKARRALTIASVSLIIVSSLDIRNDTIEIFSLVLGVSKDWLIVAAHFAVFYLALNFYGYAATTTLERNPDLIKDIITSEKGGVPKAVQDFIHSTLDEDELKGIIADRRNEGAFNEVPPEYLRWIGTEEARAHLVLNEMGQHLGYRVQNAARLRSISELLLPATLAFSSIIFANQDPAFRSFLADLLTSGF